MISATAEQGTADKVRTSKRRALHLQPGMWIAVALVFAAQMALMFLLGKTPATKPLDPPAAPTIYVGTNHWDELLALRDPTLFVLPHSNNFSGPAWLKIPWQTFDPTNWSEPARPLPLPPEKLGEVFVAFMDTNSPPRFQADAASESDLVNPVDSTPMQSISAALAVRVEGDLAGRQLLTPIHLAPQTNSDFDVLPDTEVQVLVDAQGKAFTPVIISSSKNSIADAAALNFARNARFAPLKAAALGTPLPDAMTFGKLIFEWQTMPPAPTNALPATP